jgi:murein DD-endopeptidase MepM/ murein hydrolase activator NlpD
MVAAFAACSSRKSSTSITPFSPLGYAAPRFDWPIARGKLSSGFGLRHGVMHEGIDIAAPVGTPVMAAAAGQVIFVGRMRGYGNIVIIEHQSHYVTVYAHDSSNLVREGQNIRQGQLIGYVGRSGRTTGANLHFEVRHNNVAKNPLAYLLLPPAYDDHATRLAGGGGSRYFPAQ